MSIQLDWSIEKPFLLNSLEKSIGTPPWLEEVWSLRGLTLFEKGRRPQFKTADGDFLDSDPSDYRSYHLLARSNGVLLGCLRLSGLDNEPCITESLMGTTCLNLLLDSTGCRRNRTVEVGRWVVHPEFQDHSIGIRLIAGGWALLRTLPFDLAIATVGKHGGQDKMLGRTGLMYIPDTAPIFSSSFADEICFMYAILSNPAPGFCSSIDEMAKTLALEVRNTQTKQATISC